MHEHLVIRNNRILVIRSPYEDNTDISCILVHAFPSSISPHILVQDIHVCIALLSDPYRILDSLDATDFGTVFPDIVSGSSALDHNHVLDIESALEPLLEFQLCYDVWLTVLIISLRFQFHAAGCDDRNSKFVVDSAFRRFDHSLEVSKEPFQ